MGGGVFAYNGAIVFSPTWCYTEKKNKAQPHLGVNTNSNQQRQQEAVRCQRYQLDPWAGRTLR